MAQITVPEAPTVEIKTFSDHIKLLWSMDEQNQYGIEMYVIDVIKHNGETEKRFECNVKDGAHYCQLAGLSSESNYQLMVQACNKAGCGASSIFSVATTASSGVFPTVIIVLFVLLLLFTCCIANYDIIKEFIRPLTKRLTNNHFHQSNSMEERRERESLQEVLDILENSMETTRPSNSVYHTTPSTSLALDEFPRSGEQDSREPPPSGTSAPAAAKCGRPLSYDTIVLQAEVHRENQMASFLQYDEKQMASSPQYEKQMASPQYEKQMASSPQYEKQMASSPQYEKQMASSPQYDEKQMASSPQYEKQMASSPQYEKQMDSSQYEKQMASPQNEKQMAPPQYEKQMDSPQYEKQMASPQYEKQMASPQYEKMDSSPQYEKQMDSSPQYDEKQMASSPQYEKQMALSQCYNEPIISLFYDDKQIADALHSKQPRTGFDNPSFSEHL